ncbi:RNA-binding domain-containing protein [Streptomyces melanogenes]|uniref:RNA-binding domain-containing protein n=1 Tax=Streptomyces melanogenes TaxID=67326 RepID=UPI0037B23490
MDREAARAVLDAHNPAALLGVCEGQWLDAKSHVYNMKDPRAVEELAKDVAAFANGGGGLLVLGISTRKEHEEEVLHDLTGIDRSTVDLDQLRKLIRERVTPPPHVTVGWSGSAVSGVVFIDIVTPEPDCVYVVAAPVGKPGQPRNDTAAVPLRQADGTHWLLRPEIQRLLTAGRTVVGMPGVDDPLRSDRAYIERTIKNRFHKWNEPGSGRHRLMRGCTRDELGLAERASWEDEDLRLFLLGSAIQQRYMLRYWLDACRSIPRLPDFLGKIMSTVLNGRRPPLRASWCAVQLPKEQREVIVATAGDGDRALEEELASAILDGDTEKAKVEIERILRAQFGQAEVVFEMRELTASDDGDFPLL